MLGFDPVSLSTLYIMAGLSACPQQGRVEVNVKLDITEKPYITDKTSAWLTQNYGNDLDSSASTDGKWMVGGLTMSNMKVGYRVSFNGHTNTKTDSTCVSVKGIDMTVIYSPDVYIASDYKLMGCRYSQTLAHEKRHVSADKSIINQYIPYMKRALQDYAQKLPPQGPYPKEQLAAEQQRITEQIAASVKTLQTQLVDARRKKQATIDTRENYLKESAMCPGQFPKFD